MEKDLIQKILSREQKRFTDEMVEIDFRKSEMYSCTYNGEYNRYNSLKQEIEAITYSFEQSTADNLTLEDTNDLEKLIKELQEAINYKITNPYSYNTNILEEMLVIVNILLGRQIKYYAAFERLKNKRYFSNKVNKVLNKVSIPTFTELYNLLLSKSKTRINDTYELFNETYKKQLRKLQNHFRYRNQRRESEYITQIQNGTYISPTSEDIKKSKYILPKDIYLQDELSRIEDELSTNFPEQHFSYSIEHLKSYIDFLGNAINNIEQYNIDILEQMLVLLELYLNLEITDYECLKRLYETSFIEEYICYPNIDKVILPLDTYENLKVKNKRL